MQANEGGLIRKISIPALISILLPFLFLFSYVVRDKFVFSIDTSSQFFTVCRWFWNHVSHGEWPLWNPGIFGGFYQFASLQCEFVSPLNAPFYWILPGYWPPIASMFFSLMLAGFGAYRLAGEFKLPAGLRVSFVALFVFSGPLLSLIDRSPLFHYICVYPWIALSILAVCRRPSPRSAVFLGTCFALVIHSGDVNAVALFGLSGLVTLFAFQWASRTRSLVAMGGGIVIALLLSAIVVLPMQENLSSTLRGAGFSFGDASIWSMHPMRVLQMLVPELWGSVYAENFWGQTYTSIVTTRFWFHSLYFGAVALPLIVLGFWRTRKNRIAWLIVLPLAFTLCLSFGAFFPLHSWLFTHVPAYTHVRFPEKFVIYAICFAMLFQLFALQSLTREFNPGKSHRIWLGLWLIVAAIHALSPLIARGFLTLNAPQAGPLIFDSLREAAAFHAIFALFAIMFAWQAYRDNLRVMDWLFAGFLVLELIAFSPVQRMLPYQLFAGEPSRIAKVIARDPGRIFRDESIPVTRHFRERLDYNWGMLDGVEFVSGYENIIPDRFDFSTNEMFRNLPIWSAVYNARYVLTPIVPRNPILKNWFERGLLEPVYFDHDENLVLLKIKRESASAEFKSQFFAVDSAMASRLIMRQRQGPGEPAVIEANRDSSNIEAANLHEIAELEKNTVNTRSWSVKAPSDGIFLIRERYHPAWKFTIDGEPVQSVRADYINSAVFVPQGQHRIEARFSPKGFETGWRLTVSGIIFCLLLLVVPTLTHAFKARRLK